MICMGTCFLWQCGPPRPRFSFFPRRRNAGTKKPSIFRRGRRRRQDGPTDRHRRDSTPILSVARQSPGPHSPGLDERKKAGLLTSGSSYSLRLTARLRAVASWSFRRPLQRRYRTGFTPVSLFSPALVRGTFWRVGPAVEGRAGFKELEREYGFGAGRSSGLTFSTNVTHYV